MELNIGSKLCGFTVTRIREEKEIDGRLVEMVHDHSGAKLCWVDNGDVNKLFSITFKTIVDNSTGVPHILEHSVLCGSEKYPVKEPFVDLLKGSMNTFLNAMTFQDKTMYPVSSRNEKDFLNLTSVYLDAVFAPAILKNPNIFYQEGWHIEQAEDGKLSYKGVVFNEMKGAVSDVDDFLTEEMLGLVYPDNGYGVNSGGEPAVIPTLTYEEFIRTYKRFYHPSNARVFLDGAVPLEKTLEMIDGYLSNCERLVDLPGFIPQVPRAAEKTVDYALAEDEDIANKGRLMAGKIFAGCEDPLKSLAASVLFNAIADSNDSPLKKAVLDSGLAQDMSVDVIDDIPQVFYQMQFKNVKDGKDGELWKLVTDKCAQLAEEGIDRKALIAAINRNEFMFKSPQEPAGLIRCIKSMVTWLHDGDPMTYLAVDGLYAQLREKLQGRYFEDLLAELVSADALCLLHARASHTAAAEKDAAEAAKLAEIAASWTDADREANRKLNEELQAWQQTPDSAEAKASLPKLPISEVSEEPQWDDTIIQNEGGVSVLYHPVPSRGIVNFNLYFALTDKSLAELTRLSALSQLLGELPTANHSSVELAQDVKTYLGSLSFKVGAFSRRSDPSRAIPCLMANASVLKENLSIAEELVTEILLTTKFDDTEKIRNIITQADMISRQTMVGAGHAFARAIAMSGYSAEAAVADAVSGYSAAVWLHKMAGEFDGRIKAFTELLESSLKAAVCRRRLVASQTSTEYVSMAGLFEALPVGSFMQAPAQYTADLPEKAGCKIPALVGFSSQAYHLSREGEDFDGSLYVASNILSFDYLWNKVRVQGGAYGTGFRADGMGYITTYSFRDPTPARSIGINKELGAYLRSFCEAKTPLDNFIIASVASTEPLLAPAVRGLMADKLWFSGYTYGLQKKLRSQMLHTDYDKLQWCADIADAMAEKGRIAAVGQESQLAAFEDMEILDL
ncbi:MAG: insulinase family protein [Firmicutes bacterium]|nr:insulinase family protein [Bacillota bacterium]